ncbi:glycoside hydrolase family 2 protein [Trichoderma virens Gv29-8]|uniref:Exo-beta-D-glucosaminidase n=1 Tax=Hypocrea virens (strain Gv29-8 / FGSC 10586) TaxID=413071 RepID=G9MZV2_HYPVG|nr:glycoside hydrolase family 2 protein [Trichoderma virens Gv29-8]EHK20158.1 glycoside hydrolase family 2 protein [Trichoderma virens Gv29-8]UKZ45905.1 1,3-beta-glucan synthase [Trichoderma virens]
MIAKAVAALLLGSGLASAAGTPLTSKAGDKVPIPDWDLKSSSEVSKDLKGLSKPGVDTSAWYHAGTSKCTLMACLLNAGIYKDEDLWYSDNLNHFNWGQFSVPWLYRHEFALAPAKGKHFILQTNGITSKADLFFNGQQIADSEYQAGAYAGRTYDITSLAAKDNAFVVQVHPTDYLYDFALGYVDWNPYPPDNGTGIWRDITVKETGSVSMGPISVVVDIAVPVESSPAKVTIRAEAQNLENVAVVLDAEAVVSGNSCSGGPLKQTVKLAPGEKKLVEFTKTIAKPKIWWPKQWGDQPLYNAKVTFSVNKAVSDTAQTNFGVRKVTSFVNQYNDTQYSVNGHPFQVVGGGYGADMFLRWDGDRFTRIVEYMLDMHQNTIRLEGKMEHPELYEICDKYGLMVMPGWECCDKWEAWAYNDELAIFPPPVWDDNDYQTANYSMIHEASMLQPHPSVLTFLVGSDFWPNDEAVVLYVNALKNAGWQTPIIASASKRGFPALLGPGGMKMDGPYDWVPPNYWYDTEPSEDRLGAAFGFGSELGAGVGTPELGSLKRFLSQSDLNDLWKNPNKNLYHMSTNVSSFYNRKIYNQGLFKRYGAPTSLDDYLLKAQMMDYEATRAQYEGFSSLWTASRPATGNIYWMLNNAWPSLHWNQFDYYMHPAGSYFGTKVGSRIEHVAYNYQKKEVWVINHSLDQTGPRKVDIELIDTNGKQIAKQSVNINTKANSGFKAADISSQIGKLSSVAFLRLILSDSKGNVLSRNVYWVTNSIDKLDWDSSTWYYTQVTSFVDYTPLNKLSAAQISVTTGSSRRVAGVPGTQTRTVTLENKSSVPAVFIRLTLVDKSGNDVNPVSWSDNYVTLWPKEKLQLEVGGWDASGDSIQVSGRNIAATTVKL